MFNKEFDVAKLEKRLVAAEELFNRWLMNEINHVFQNSTLQEDTKAFLNPSPLRELEDDVTAQRSKQYSRRWSDGHR